MSDVQELLEELADDGEARGADAVFAGATQHATKRRRSRRRIRIASAFGSAVAVVVVIAIVAQSSGTERANNRVGVEPDATTRTTTNAIATVAQLAAGHWSTIPPAPIEPRIRAAVVWTGKELILWGGEGDARQGYFSDGAAFDPSRGTWRKLAASPLGPRMGAAAAWTGTEMIVWGGAGGRQGAIYQPESDSWRPMATSPITSRGPTPAVWTGDRFVVLAGARGAAYDPRTNAWHQLPPIPGHSLPGFEVHQDGLRLAVAAGSGRILVWSMWSASRAVSATTRQGAGGTDVLRYDEASNGWTWLAAAPDASRQPREGFWTGTRVLVRGNQRVPGTLVEGSLPEEAGALYDPETGRVTSLPANALEADPRDSGPVASAWTGRALLSLAARVPPGMNTNTSTYDEASNTWSFLSPAPFTCAGFAPAVWTGGEVLVYCPGPSPAQPNEVGGLRFIPG